MSRITSDPEYTEFYEVLPESADTEATDDVALEDMDDSFDDEGESSEDTEESAEAEDTDGESEEIDAEDESKEEPEPEKPTESDEEMKKRHNREMAEKRLQDKQTKEAELKKQQDDYIAEADKEDPRDLAVRQLQIDAYNNNVEKHTNKLANAYERAIKDFPILSDASPEIVAERDDALDAFQARYVTLDKFNNPTEVRGDLYAYLQRKADSITALTGKGARQQIESKDKEKSKALPTPSRAPKEPKKDLDMEGFDEEAKRW